GRNGRCDRHGWLYWQHCAQDGRGHSQAHFDVFAQRAQTLLHCEDGCAAREWCASRVEAQARPARLRRRRLSWLERRGGQSPWLEGRAWLCQRPRYDHRHGGVGNNRAYHRRPCFRRIGAQYGSGSFVIRSQVIGLGSYLPEKALTNVELAKRVDTSDE